MMKSILFMIAVITLSTSTAFALWNPFKGMIEAKVADEVAGVSQKFFGETNGIKGDMSLMKGSIGKLLEANISLSAKIDQQNKGIVAAQAQMQDIKSGRDTNINDTDLMWKIIYGLLGVITLLIGNDLKKTRMMYREMSNARFYQLQLAAELDADKLEKIMEKKKGIDHDKSLIGKTGKVIGSSVNAVTAFVKSKKERV